MQSVRVKRKHRVFKSKKISLLDGKIDYSHIITAVVSALLTISIAAGSYQNKIDTLINENKEIKLAMKDLSENKEVKLAMKELSGALNDLSIKVSVLSQKMDDRIKK